MSARQAHPHHLLSFVGGRCAMPENAWRGAIADQLPLGIWVARASDGAFVYANRAFEEIMGMGPVAEMTEPAVRSEPYGIYTRDGRLYPEDELPFARALATRSTVVVDDLVIHRPDGRRVYVRAVAQPMFEGDDIKQISIAVRDITAEVRAAEGLANVLAHMPIVIFAFDRHGLITVSEGRGLERMGLRPSELVGQNVLELFRDNPRFLDNSLRALRGESFRVTEPFGEGIFETTFSPVRDASGEVSHVIGISADVTERVEMERRLVQVERLAAMGTLAASVAHEIANPLTYVLANLETLGSRVGEREKPLVADIREGAERVRRIVRDLSSFSRDDELSQPTDVVSVLERAVALAELELKQRARVVRDYHPVPFAVANDARLGQVFLNLLVNAAHAIPEGNPRDNEIRLRTRAVDGDVLIEVEDTGTGMTPELVARIFEPFFTTNKAGSGTGLGLSICERIVEGFGGSITAQSEVDRGSVFSVRLRTAPEREGEVEAEVRRDAPPESATILRRLRAIVIDDEVRVAAAIRRLLEGDHDVDIETDARRALERLLRTDYDVVLCDLMMPGLSGMDLYGELVRSAPNVAARIVFVTGGASTPAAQQFLAKMANPCLEKPIDRKQLDRLLRERATCS
ncbi:MAG: PAS domain-containing hybrid sensor histidine kinase/response regulator [Polyangiales bacterium]